MPEPAPREHRRKATAGRQHGRDEERDAIAEPAGGMLVEHRAGQVPAQHLAAVAHGAASARRCPSSSRPGLAEPMAKAPACASLTRAVGRPRAKAASAASRQRSPRAGARCRRARIHRSCLAHVVCAEGPGQQRAQWSRVSRPEMVAIVMGVSGPPNSSSFWRQPPQGGTGRGALGHDHRPRRRSVSPAATMAAMAPASAHVPSG